MRALPAPHPTIRLLQTSSLTSVVQGEIERMILGGELAPGTRLTEAALAAKLGVSRGPLREAFRMLDEAGLVRTEKNRGVFVRTVSASEAVEIFDLRAAMDELVGRRLAEQITPAQLKELRGLLEPMEQASRARDVERHDRLDLQFHDRLVEFTGNAKLAAIYRRLTRELNLFCRPALADGRHLPGAGNGHRAIVKAIASGDPQAAGRAMFDHVMARKQCALREPAARPRSAAASLATT
jgi:phosphonate utilization transcriptional regulator